MIYCDCEVGKCEGKEANRCAIRNAPASSGNSELFSLVTDENLTAVIEGTEQEIRSMMQEFGPRPIENRVLEIQASLLELIKYGLKER